jgi:dephospho-CoA kinase
MTTTGQKPVLGLVGGIGAGKSSVGAALVNHGGILVAADPFGHEALEQPDLKGRILEVWGERNILNDEGKIDRKKLGRIVFPSPVERSRLEHIVHPYIEERIRQAIEAAQQNPKCRFVILDAAIMLEARWHDVCDHLIYVDAPREIRLARIQQQRGWTDQDLANREAVQMPTDRKKELADAVIDNSGSPEKVPSQVEALIRTWNLG